MGGVIRHCGLAGVHSSAEGTGLINQSSESDVSLSFASDQECRDGKIRLDHFILFAHQKNMVKP